MNGTPAEPSFHEGERALQQGTGSLERLAQIGPRVIRNHMPGQHREFFAQLPFLVAGTVDAQGQPWASILCGPPGFAHSPDPRRLVVHARPLPSDPLAQTLALAAPIGLLGIEPHTRRRNRLNGRVAQQDAQSFTVQVEQSFGNCPKYIQARQARYAPLPRSAPAVRLEELDAAACRLIQCSDTFFIASAHPLAGRGGTAAHGVDVSHRGGKPGFVHVAPHSVLTIPDFPGNFFFNTLGNLAINPRCGLLFMDFANGDLLYLAALGEIVAGGNQVAAFEGAQRLLRLTATGGWRVPAALPLRWGPAQLSPALEATGSWH